MEREKVGSRSADAGKEASWQQVLEYNASQNVTEKSTTKSIAAEDTDGSKNVILDPYCDVSNTSTDERLPLKDQTAADNPDGRHYLTVDAASRTGQAGHKAPKSRSAQDLSKQPDVSTAHRRSTESLSKDRRGTLPALGQLQMEDRAVLSRRRSFSGALHKAATAVAVRYRGLRNSVKAASADLLIGVGDGSHDKSMRKSDKASSSDLG